MPEPTNEDRAEWALCALERFARKTGQDESGDLADCREIVISDLICSLMHLCDRDGIDADQVIQNARGNYFTEVGAYKSADSQ